MKLSPQQFIDRCQQIVGQEGGWEDRIAGIVKANPNTIRKMAVKGSSHGMTVLLNNKLGLPNEGDPSDAETIAFYRKRDKELGRNDTPAIKVHLSQKAQTS